MTGTISRDTAVEIQRIRWRIQKLSEELEQLLENLGIIVYGTTEGRPDDEAPDEDRDVFWDAFEAEVDAEVVGAR
jgi:hypothetical protein